MGDLQFNSMEGVGMLIQNGQAVFYVNESSGSGGNHGGGIGTQHDGMSAFLCNYVPSTERVLYVDENGVLQEGLANLGLNQVFLSQDFNQDDDGETPSYMLDHMYAKKPKEPGTESTPKPRRRSKRREQVVQEYVVPEPAPQAPKINIIRSQRLPNSVYKSLSPSKPKILQGASQKNSSMGSSSQSVHCSTGISSVTHQRRDKNSSGGATSGRSAKKEDPLAQPGTYVPLEEDGRACQAKTSNGSNGARFGKELNSLSKSFKPLMSKMNPNPNLVILDDLQSRAVSGPGYEEEMLFDFGISEDDDEVNAALSTEVSEAFNDVVFDECEFASGLDYGSSVSSSQKPSSPRSSILGFNSSCSQRSKRMVSNLAAASLPFGVSDDDDSNQIMVSMSGRRRSKEWDHMSKKDPDSPESQNFQDTKTSFDLKDIDKTSFVDNTETDAANQPSEINHNDCASVSEESIESLSQNEMHEESSQESSISLDVESNPFSDPPSPKVHALASDAISIKPTVSTSKSPDDLRRSRRAVKAPVWLDDNVDTSSPKRRRR